MAEVVKRLHMISQIIGIIHNNPYDLSGTAGIERPFTKLLQQRFVTIHTDIIFDNRIAFFFLSVDSGTSHWNAASLIGFEADSNHPSCECPASQTFS